MKMRRHLKICQLFLFFNGFLLKVTHKIIAYIYKTNQYKTVCKYKGETTLHVQVYFPFIF